MNLKSSFPQRSRVKRRELIMIGKDLILKSLREAGNHEAAAIIEGMSDKEYEQFEQALEKNVGGREKRIGSCMQNIADTLDEIPYTTESIYISILRLMVSKMTADSGGKTHIVAPLEDLLGKFEKVMVLQAISETLGVDINFNFDLKLN